MIEVRGTRWRKCREDDTSFQRTINGAKIKYTPSTKVVQFEYTLTMGYEPDWYALTRGIRKVTNKHQLGKKITVVDSPAKMRMKPKWTSRVELYFNSTDFPRDELISTIVDEMKTVPKILYIGNEF